MTEIEIHDRSGDFNIVGTKDCTIFEYKSRSKMLVWEMNWNSLMNYFVGEISKQPVLYIQYFNDLQKNLEQGTIDGANIIEQFRPLLGSFSNAKYKLEVLEIGKLKTHLKKSEYGY